MLKIVETVWISLLGMTKQCFIRMYSKGERLQELLWNMAIILLIQAVVIARI